MFSKNCMHDDRKVSKQPKGSKQLTANYNVLVSFNFPLKSSTYVVVRVSDPFLTALNVNTISDTIIGTAQHERQMILAAR